VPLLPDRPRVALHCGRVHQLRHVRRYAERLACSAKRLLRIPDSLSDEAAARVQIAFGTAWHMLFTRGRLAFGETVHDQLGRQRQRWPRFQLARLAGRDGDRNAAPTRSSSGRSSSEWITGSITRTQDVVAEVMRLTDDRGVDLVFEHVGGELFQKGLESLAKDGRLVICGGHSVRSFPSTHPVLPHAAADHRLVHL